MADFVGSQNPFIVSIGGNSVKTNNKFRGLHECVDGDTNLKYGEATILENIKVTSDFNLKRRPGTKLMLELGLGEIQGMWSGYLNNIEYFLVVCDNKLYRLFITDHDHMIFDKVFVGDVEVDKNVRFFPFNNVVYMLTGKEYYFFDGENVRYVTGYRPLVATATPPEGGGELLEQVNKLNGMRRQWLSPDGTATTFQLAEVNIVTVDYVMYNNNGEYMSPTEYTFDKELGQITFNSVLDAIPNSIEVGYSMPISFRREVVKMTDFVLYSGAQNTRVVIYGDGSNEFFYSSLDYDGIPRADYFPDLNESALGSTNTQITAMCNHNSTLIAWKEDSAYSIAYGLQADAKGNYIECFYGTLISTFAGCDCKSSVALIDGSPYTLFAKSLYRWKHTSYYTSALSSDERDAQRVSDRIYDSLGKFNFKNCVCYDDNFDKEYYIINKDTKEALVYNYVADAWYKYNNFNVSVMCRFEDYMFIGTQDGRILHLSSKYYNDCGVKFKSLFKSGAMSMDAPYRLKNTTYIHLTIKPESHGEMWVTVESDRKTNYTNKAIYSRLWSYDDVNYDDVSYVTNRNAKSQRLKIKCKKYEYIYLIIESDDLYSSFTLNEAYIKATYGGYSK